MSEGRANYFSEPRFSAHCRSFKKRPRSRDILSLVVFAVLALVLLISLSQYGAAIVSGIVNLKPVLPRNLELDYAVFISHALPGMSREAAAIEHSRLPPEDSPAELKLPVQANPQLILHSELAGFKVLEARYHDPAISDYPYNEQETVEEPVLPEEEGEGISFLLGKRSPYPREKPFRLEDGHKPLVLIYHTHASESFIPVSGQPFTANPELTVVSLGEQLAELLESNYGIPVLHHKEVYDIPRDPAYQKARPGIERMLKGNPQIQVVLDLHRDGVARQATTARVGETSTAKILFVIGTKHERWHDNLRFALFLEKAMEERYPGLSRGIRRHSFIYNQDLHPRCLIVEIGGHENNRDEIMKAVSCFAEVLAAAFQ